MKRRKARFEPFMELVYKPEDLLHSDHKTTRFITPQENAFVASRITTSVLVNGGITDKVSYDVFIHKWRDDYMKFTDRKPSKFKMGCIVKILVQYGIIDKINRRKATPIYSLGPKNPYCDPKYKYTPPRQETANRDTANEDTAKTTSLKEQKAKLNSNIVSNTEKLKTIL